MLTRLPAPGQTKTRLVPALGAEGAAGLQRLLTEHVALELSALGASGEARVEIWHERGTARWMRGWLGAVPRYRPQAGGDLGARLQAVMEQAFAEGAARCLVVGSDCPGMTADHLRGALAALETADLVLGPATDGGYWLVGLRASAAPRALPALFQAVSWGSAEVLRQTEERAAAAGLAMVRLEPLADIDRPEDLPEWGRRRDVPPSAMRVSVVIPTVEEQKRVGRAIASALAGGAAEVVVADGGSNDATEEVAAQAGAIVVQAPRGRARQLNAGAARATGDVLLFLHADTTLPPGAAPLVRRALGTPGVVAGAFAHRSDGVGALGWLLTTGGRLRCRLSGHPYGDQALFLRRRTFRALGGFPDLPVMEDWELVARLRRLGRVLVLPEEAVTSSASFDDHGLLWSGVITAAVILGYQLGVDPARLAAWRRRIARRAG
jgi:hypothetical protein